MPKGKCTAVTMSLGGVYVVDPSGVHRQDGMPMTKKEVGALSDSTGAGVRVGQVAKRQETHQRLLRKLEARRAAKE